MSKNSSNTSQKSTVTDSQWAYAALFLIPLFTIWGNILVCLAVHLEKRLQKRFNFFLVSLSMSDLLCALLVMPVSAWKMIRGGDIPEVPREVCLAWYSLDVFFTASTIIHLCTISIDRYFALNNPLRYHSTKRKSSLIMKIFIAWLVPFCIACPLFILALQMDDGEAGSFKGCGPNNVYFILTATVVTFVLPLMIMIVTYILTVCTIVRQAKRAHAHLSPVVVFHPRSNSTAIDSKDIAQKPSRSHIRKDVSEDYPSSSSVNIIISGVSTTSGVDTTAVLANITPNAEKQCVAGHTHSLSAPNFHKSFLTPPNRLNNSSRMFQQQHSIENSLILSHNSSKISGEHPLHNSTCPNSPEIKRSQNNLYTPPNSPSTSHRGSYTNQRQKANKAMAYIHKGQKAVQVLGILFGLFVVCYLPFFVIYLTDFFCVACRSVTEGLVPKMEWIGYIASMLNPIVYHIFNPTFRTTFHRIMRCKCERVSYLSQPKSRYT